MDTAIDESVMCAKCGARMKVTRPYCLRCLEPLDPTKPPSLWRSLTVSNRVGEVAVAVVIVAVTAFAWVLWSTNTSPPVTTDAQPAWSAKASVTPPRPITDVPSSPQPTATGDPVAADTADAGADDASSAFEGRLKTNPDDPIAVNGFGLALQGEQRFADAAVQFKHATEIAPGNPQYRMNLAGVEARLGQWRKAVDDYREAEKLLPDDYSVHYRLALALHELGDNRAAIAEYDTAINISPGDPAAYRSLGVALESVGRVDDAVNAYDRFVELSRGTDESRRVLAHVDAIRARVGR